MLWTVPLVLAAAPCVAQDQAASGFLLEERPYPSASSFAATARLSSGELVVFDGLEVNLFTADGTLVRELGELQAFVFPSLVLVDPTEDRAILGESTNGDLLKVSLRAASGPDLVVHLPFNYDAVFEDDDHLLVSAASCGFGCGNEIWRVQLSTRSVSLVARVAGASGPLALDPAGNLYYGTATATFPPPPKPSRVIRWDAAQIQGSLGLDESDAVLIGGGFSGAAGLAIDSLRGDVFLLENNFATGENRIRRVLGSADESPVLVEGRPFFSMGNLDFLPGDGPAVFLPYQPPTGGVLHYTTTDFATSVERFELVPRRPSLALSGAGLLGPGPFDVSVNDGPPRGLARILFCPRALVPPSETVLSFHGIPLFVGLNLPTLGSVPGFLSLDGTGNATRTYQNPGGYEGQFALQILLFDSDLRIVGTSSSAFL